MIQALVSLSAGHTAQQARQRRAGSETSVVLVRWKTLDGTQNYVFSPEHADGALEGASDGTALVDVFGLRATEEHPVIDIDRIGQTAYEGGAVLVSGDRVIGVLDPDEEVPSWLVPELEVIGAPGAFSPRRSLDEEAPEMVTFNAEASVEGPERVALQEMFSLTVTLRGPSAISQGDAVSLQLEAGVTEFELDVLIVADGFEIAEPRAKLPVDVTNLDASTITVELSAVTPPEDATSLADESGHGTWHGSIAVIFMYKGTPVGTSMHRLLVELGRGDVSSRSTPATPEASADGSKWLGSQPPMALAPIVADIPEPDITILISGSEEGATGRYGAFLYSPHGETPSQPFKIDLGIDGATFAAQTLNSIPRMDGNATSFENVEGISHRIADSITGTDDEGRTFWAIVSGLLTTAHESTGEIPTVLLLTSDPFLPWELAHLGGSLIDASAPPFLAAQARVGRWVLDGGNPMAGALETTIEVSRMLTVVGHYGEGQRWTRLPEAEAEGEYLSANFGAQSVTAEGTEIEALLRARLRPPPQLMHFACHGTSADGANALVINDGALLPEYVFERCKAGSEYRPFVFLNACRGGAAQTQLARYGGFAATLLRAGCRGFIGPLWDVNDKIALEVATTFYSEVAAGVTPAEILRSIRAGYVDVDGRPDPPSTLLAYVYYGHPAALITGIHKKPS